MGWMVRAYELGKQGCPNGMTPATLRRIFADPDPSNWIKWWRRGFHDGEREKRDLI